MDTKVIAWVAIAIAVPTIAFNVLILIGMYRHRKQRKADAQLQQLIHDLLWDKEDQ